MRKSFLVLIFIFISVTLFSQQKDMEADSTEVSDYSMKLSGVFMGRYQLSTDSWKSMFSVANARVGLSGDITKYLEYKAQVELSSDGKFAVLDLYGSVKPTDWLTLKFGQQPVGIYNSYIVSHREMQFATLNFIAEYISPTRDIGLTADIELKKGDFPIVLHAGLLNGGTINQPEWRSTFAYFARMVFGSMEGFRASAKMYKFSHVDTEDYLMLGADVRYENKAFKVEAEAMNRHNYYNDNDLLVTYIQGAYFIPLSNSGIFKRMIPALRWETLSHDLFSGGSGINRITAGYGFAFEVKRISSVLRLDYEIFIGDKQMPEFIGIEEATTNKFTLELMIEF